MGLHDKKYGTSAVKWECSTSYCSTMWDPWIKSSQQNSKSGAPGTGPTICKDGAGGTTGGSDSAYSSGSTYTSASTPTPTPATTTTKHVVESTLTLVGVPASAFSGPNSTAVKTAFKSAVASGLQICGSTGTSQCTASDVVITSVTRRRGSNAKVTFQVTTTKAAATAGATALKTYLEKKGAGGFTESLKAEAAKAGGAAALQKVTSVTGISTKATTKSTAVSSSTKTAMVSGTALAMSVMAVML